MRNLINNGKWRVTLKLSNISLFSLGYVNKIKIISVIYQRVPRHIMYHFTLRLCVIQAAVK